MKRRAIPTVVVIAVAVAAVANDKPRQGQAVDKERLASLQNLVGTWKGVGQIKRGSSDGAWGEEAEWAWRFTTDHAELVFTTPKGKYFKTGALRPGEKRGEFQLAAQPAAGGDELQYQGKLAADGQLVLTAVGDDVAADLPHRISLRTVAGGDRLVVLYEQKSSVADRFNRMSEVGSTRKGSGFGQGGTGPECVVTGGFGSMTVTFQGETYYVCCTGCRDLFQEDPQGVIDEYKTKKAAEKEKRKQDAKAPAGSR